MIKKYSTKGDSYVESSKFGETKNGMIVGLYRHYLNGILVQQTFYDRNQACN